MRDGEGSSVPVSCSPVETTGACICRRKKQPAFPDVGFGASVQQAGKDLGARGGARMHAQVHYTN